MIRSDQNEHGRVRATRVFFLGLLLLLGAALALSACFGGDDAPQAAPTPPPASDDPQPSQQPAAAQQTEQPAEPQAVSATEPQEQAAEPQADEEAAEPEPTATNEYVVQAGDTLADIAYAHDVRLDDLIQLNNIQNPNLLRVGQRLLIPSDEPAEAAAVAAPTGGESTEEEQQAGEQAEAVETPTVSLPNTALALATPTSTSASQFSQPGPDATTNTIPTPPANFIQYGVDALPWLQGRGTVDEILPIFFAWPMPPLVVGNNRLNLVDTNGNGLFSAAMVFTDPNSFGAAVPFSNLVVYDPVPGRADRYRIGYDHRLAYGREVQGLQLLSDLDLSGDAIRDITFREISCAGEVCTSAFYVLRGSGDGYQVVTGPDAQINAVSTIQVVDGTADGVPDLIATGVSSEDGETYSFTLAVQAGALVEVSRILQSN